MSIEIMPAVNGCINKGKQICYFGEVYQYDADSKRLSTDIIGDEILENMYKRGFLNKEDNETKWNLGDKRNSWRTRALECLTEEMMKDGVAGVEELFKSADKDGSGERELTRDSGKARLASCRSCCFCPSLSGTLIRVPSAVPR